jgi:hypothetical protein
MELCRENKCRRRHRRLLYVETAQAKARQSPVERNASVSVSELTQVEDRRLAVQLVAQWVNTPGGGSCLVFWDTGSQVTLITHKAAQAMRLQP